MMFLKFEIFGISPGSFLIKRRWSDTGVIEVQVHMATLLASKSVRGLEQWAEDGQG